MRTIIAALLLSVGEARVCPSVNYYNPEAFYNENCVSMGVYDWSKKNLSTVGSIEQILTIMFFIASIICLYCYWSGAEKGEFRSWWTKHKSSIQENKLLESIVKAIRIQIHVREQDLIKKAASDEAFLVEHDFESIFQPMNENDEFDYMQAIAGDQNDGNE